MSEENGTGKVEEPRVETPKVKKWKIPEEIGVLIGFIVICAIFAFICHRNGKPQFTSFENIVNVARQISMITIVAVGMTFVIISAGIDLSVGAVVAFTGVITAQTLIATGGNGFAAILAGLSAGTAVGVFNGFIVANFKVPPFIVTLATMIGVRGWAFILCKGRPVSIEGPFENIGSGEFLGVPIPIYIMIGVIIAGWYLATHTKWGRYIYALGGNEEASRLSGINIKSMKLFIFGLSGFLAALAGIINTARLTSGDPKEGSLFELDAIAAAVVGGTSLSGGRGKIIGTVLGAFIIGVIKNALDILGIESYTQMFIKGGVIMAAVLIDQIRKDENVREYAIKCIPWVIGLFIGSMAYKMLIPSINSWIGAGLIGMALFAGIGIGGHFLMTKIKK